MSQISLNIAILFKNVDVDIFLNVDVLYADIMLLVIFIQTQGFLVVFFLHVSDCIFVCLCVVGLPCSPVCVCRVVCLFCFGVGLGVVCLCGLLSYVLFL